MHASILSFFETQLSVLTSLEFALSIGLAAAVRRRRRSANRTGENAARSARTTNRNKKLTTTTTTPPPPPPGDEGAAVGRRRAASSRLVRGLLGTFNHHLACCRSRVESYRSQIVFVYRAFFHFIIGGILYRSSCLVEAIDTRTSHTTTVVKRLRLNLCVDLGERKGNRSLWKCMMNQ
jgi:hypothetical protein